MRSSTLGQTELHIRDSFCSKGRSGWFERNLSDEVKLHDPYFSVEDLHWLQVMRAVNPSVVITVMTSRRHQPPVSPGNELEDLYAEAWRSLYDQSPPKTEIAVIGGEKSKDSPIHDRWLVTGTAGLRLGTSLNSLGITKDAEISEMSTSDVEQKRNEMDQYISREKTEHRSEKLRLSLFSL